MESARKHLLCAIGLSLVSLCFTYKGEIEMNTVALPGSEISVPGRQTVTMSGFEYRPLAVFVLLPLLLVVGTPIQRAAFWQRYGYWLVFGAMVCLTPWYSGMVCAASLGLAGWAAYEHARGRVVVG
jgi:hypothetical protein